MSPLLFHSAVQIYKYIANLVGLLGVEPRLFWTKTRRVASYTIGQLVVKFNKTSCLHKLILFNSKLISYAYFRVLNEKN